MKIKKSALALVVAASVFVGTAIGASGADAVQIITALLRTDYTVKYNGEEQILKDANGERVYPISYNNSTYVPFRALGDIIGLDVGWDAATNTVMYNTPTKPSEPEKPASKGLDLIDKCKKSGGSYYTEVRSNKNQKIRIGDDAVDHWIRLSKSNWYYGSSSLYSANTIIYNLDGQYNTLTLRAYASYDSIVTVYNNQTEDSVLGSFKVKGGAAPSDYVIAINGAFQIKISQVFDKFADGNVVEDDYLYIYNAYLT